MRRANIDVLILMEKHVAKHIDWEALARGLGTVGEDGETGSTQLARQALEAIIGEDCLKDAVDYYISRGPGGELARSVLWHLHPWSAMRYCHEIFASEHPVEDRRSAVELLRVVADERAAGWIREFLEDEDPEIQSWGAGVLDQLLWSRFVDREAVAPLLTLCLNHGNEAVVERARFIVKYLGEREDG